MAGQNKKHKLSTDRQIQWSKRNNWEFETYISMPKEREGRKSDSLDRILDMEGSSENKHLKFVPYHMLLMDLLSPIYYHHLRFNNDTH